MSHYTGWYEHELIGKYRSMREDSRQRLLRIAQALIDVDMGHDLPSNHRDTVVIRHQFEHQPDR